MTGISENSSPVIRKFDRVLISAIFFLAIWFPSAANGYPDYFEPARYFIYLFLVSVFVLNSRTIDAVLLLSKDPAGLWFIVFVSYILISSLWSAEPIFSLARALVLLGTFLFAISAATLANRTAVIQAVSLAFCLIVLGSLVVVIFFPNLGVESSYQHAGKWRGLLGQKNPFGIVCATTVILLIAPKRYVPVIFQRPIFRFLMILVSLLGIYFSESRGALGVILVGFLSLIICYFPKSVRSILVTAFLCMLPFFIGIFLFGIDIEGTKIHLFDTSFDTSNRILIWQFALDAMRGKELLGFGYGGFWTTEREDLFLSIYRWVLPNYHSGYVGMYVELGLAGSIIFFVFSIFLWKTIIYATLLNKNTSLIFVFVYCASFYVQNIYENNLLRSTNQFLLLFVFFSAFVIFINSPKCRGSVE